jgi:hypothetical protein
LPHAALKAAEQAALAEVLAKTVGWRSMPSALPGVFPRRGTAGDEANNRLL